MGLELDMNFIGIWEIAFGTTQILFICTFGIFEI